ncbi:MAG: glycoside hydrolase family 43 protein [Lachnospiraceae bacterium]|nr:glycoside hydrolase family 43 protein [Lachnospiraceae bacterium]
MKKRAVLAMTLAAAMSFQGIAAGCGSQTETVDCDYTVSYDGIETNDISSWVMVHDPSVVKADDKYYIFGSHMTAAVSEDLKSWKAIANGYKVANKVYTDLANALTTDEFAYSGSADSVIKTDDGSYHVWAPDVIYNEAQGLYYMYYCTSSTWNASNLCYATAESIEGPYEWQGALIYSGFTKRTIEYTDVLDYVDEDYAKENYCTMTNEYNYSLYPNAIDPTVFYDADGRMWMVYGSWSGGIYLLEIDEETGLVIHPEADPDNNVDAYFGKRLFGGGHESIEGPYILYDEESEYYYLYVSYGSLTSEGGYQIRVFRSKTVDGDYVDMNGEAPGVNVDHSSYGLKLSGNYFLPSLERAYMATGHNSAFIDDDGKKYLVYHTRQDDGGEDHSPRTKQYFLNEEGWPCLLPYATDGETISDSGYSNDEIVGRYYVINQGTDISAEIAEPVIWYLSEKGNVYAEGNEIIGTYEVKDQSAYVHITEGETEYSGVFCAMNDEAGTSVMTFSAVGNNESIWGVKY